LSRVKSTVGCCRPAAPRRAQARAHEFEPLVELGAPREEVLQVRDQREMLREARAVEAASALASGTRPAGAATARSSSSLRGRRQLAQRRPRRTCRDLVRDLERLDAALDQDLAQAGVGRDVALLVLELDLVERRWASRAALPRPAGACGGEKVRSSVRMWEPPTSASSLMIVLP